MLVRGGVEHDLGAHGVEPGPQAVAVADVGEHQLAAHVGPEPLGDVVEVGLVVVEQHQEGGVELGHLAGDLGADRAAGPRDEDPAPGHRGADAASR